MPNFLTKPQPPYCQAANENKKKHREDSIEIITVTQAGNPAPPAITQKLKESKIIQLPQQQQKQQPI